MCLPKLCKSSTTCASLTILLFPVVFPATHKVILVRTSVRVQCVQKEKARSDGRVTASYSRLNPASVDASPQCCPAPSMVAGPGPTLTDSGVGAHWQPAECSTVGKRRLRYRTQETERRSPISGRNVIKYSWGALQPTRMGSWSPCERFSSLTVHELIRSLIGLLLAVLVDAGRTECKTKF